MHSDVSRDARLGDSAHLTSDTVDIVGSHLTGDTEVVLYYYNVGFISAAIANRVCQLCFS